MFKYIWIWILVGVWVIWGIMAVIDVISCILDNTVLIKYRKEKPKPIDIITDVSQDLDDGTIAFIAFTISAIFVGSFLVFISD